MPGQTSLVTGKHTRRKSLDGIRAIAILGVFGFHADIPWSSGGWLGVDAFFVLSGYLITTLLLNEHDKTGTISLRRFWARRMLRLWPALLVMVVVVAPTHEYGVYPMSLHDYANSALQVVTYVADLHLAYFGGGSWGSIGQTWTLGVEMYFYLLWPPLLVFLLTRHRRLLVPALLLLTAASLAATLIVFAIKPTGIWYYYAPHTQVLPVLLGCLLAAVRHEDLLPQMGRWWGSCLAAIGLAGLLTLFIFEPGANGTTTSFFVPLVLASVATWLLLLGLEIHPNSLAAKILSWEPLAALGMVSYGFYLYQSPVSFGIGAGFILPFYAKVICMLLVSIGAATVSWLVVETQFLRIKDRLGTRVAAAAAPASLVSVEPDPPVSAVPRAADAS